MQRENQRAAAGMSTTLDPRDAGQGQHQALLPPAGQGDTVRDVQCLCYPQKGCEHNSEQRRTSKCVTSQCCSGAQGLLLLLSHSL